MEVARRQDFEKWRVVPTKSEYKRKRFEHVRELGAKELLQILQKLLLDRRDMTEPKLKAILRCQDVIRRFWYNGFSHNGPYKKLWMRWIGNVSEPILRRQEHAYLKDYARPDPPDFFDAHGMALWCKEWAIILGQRELAADSTAYVRRAEVGSALFHEMLLHETSCDRFMNCGYGPVTGYEAVSYLS